MAIAMMIVVILKVAVTVVATRCFLHWKRKRWLPHAAVV